MFSFHVLFPIVANKQNARQGYDMPPKHARQRVAQDMSYAPILQREYHARYLQRAIHCHMVDPGARTREWEGT